MKRLFFVTLVALFISSITKAQNNKNEITIGVNGAWFFDDTDYETTRIDYFLLPFNISYSRHFNPQHAVMLDYSWSFIMNGKAFTFQPGKARYREFHLFQTNYVLKLHLAKRLSQNLVSGLSYRFGGESIHLYSFDNGQFIEIVNEYNIYNDIGINIGFQTHVLVFKNISLTVEARYIKYFSDYSPNHLNTVFRVGYKF